MFTSHIGFSGTARAIVLVPGTLSHAELSWERPALKRLVERLTAFARVIVFDKRGQGLSDRNVPAEQTIEERIFDITAVMDAAGSERATMHGWSEGGPSSLVFAATYPLRTSALVLYGTFASAKDPPWSVSHYVWESNVKSLETHWGEGIMLELNSPSVWNNPVFRGDTGRWERACASPGSIGALTRLTYDLDVRHVLPVIQAPTLVMHRVGDSLVPSACGRYLAEKIPGAKFVEMPGTDHSIVDVETQDFIAEQIEEFITGQRTAQVPIGVLATVMFTDIVGSTKRAAELGDSRWHELLDTWYALVRTELAAFRGREIDTAGDGLFAAFDGPARAIRCACSMRDRVRALGLQVRTGLHTGECDLAGDRLIGIAVHIGERVASIAQPDEVLVSSTVKDLVAGAGLKFGDRGAHTLKGVPDDWRLFAVE